MTNSLLTVIYNIHSYKIVIGTAAAPTPSSDAVQLTAAGFFFFFLLKMSIIVVINCSLLP
jgi:hypothetical protein